jgi:hypothetical protein
MLTILATSNKETMDIFYNMGLILVSEIVIDIIKHVFVTRQNKLSHSVYNDFNT